ncbi:hypothetical protein ScPMuIL_003564 [Solemya velum]
MENCREWKKYITVAWAIVETLLFGGFVFGWASMVFVFKQEGIYADLCGGNNRTETPSLYGESCNINHTAAVGNMFGCNLTDFGNGVADSPKICLAQDAKFNLVFTITVFVSSVNVVSFGQINYKFGTRTTRILLILMFMTGSLMLAFVTNENPWLLFPGSIFICTSGYGITSTNVQISYLLKKGQSTFIGILNGAFDSSAVFAMAVKIAFENGISRKASYIFLTALHSMVAVSTFAFLPKMFITKQGSDNTTSTELTKMGEKTEPERNSHIGSPEMSDRQSLPTLKACMLSATYLLHLFWLSILQLGFHYFLNTLNALLTRRLKEESIVSYYTNVYQLITFSGCVFAFVGGIIYDSQRHIFRDSKSREKRDLMPAVLPMCMTCFFAMLVSGLVILPQLEVLYLTFSCVAIFRSFLYSMASGFLGAVFPSEYFGIMYGVMLFVGGCGWDVTVRIFYMGGVLCWSNSAYECSHPVHGVPVVCSSRIPVVVLTTSREHVPQTSGAYYSVRSTHVIYSKSHGEKAGPYYFIRCTHVIYSISHGEKAGPNYFIRCTHVIYSISHGEKAGPNYFIRCTHVIYSISHGEKAGPNYSVRCTHVIYSISHGEKAGPNYFIRCTHVIYSISHGEKAGPNYFTRCTHVIYSISHGEKAGPNYFIRCTHVIYSISHGEKAGTNYSIRCTHVIYSISHGEKVGPNYSIRCTHVIYSISHGEKAGPNYFIRCTHVIYSISHGEKAGPNYSIRCTHVIYSISHGEKVGPNYFMRCTHVIYSISHGEKAGPNYSIRCTHVLDSISHGEKVGPNYFTRCTHVMYSISHGEKAGPNYSIRCTHVIYSISHGEKVGPNYFIRCTHVIYSISHGEKTGPNYSVRCTHVIYSISHGEKAGPNYFIR